MMCSICGGEFVAKGLSVDDSPKRLAVSVAGMVVEVAKDSGLPEADREEQAWQAVGTSLGRQLRDMRRYGDV